MKAKRFLAAAGCIAVLTGIAHSIRSYKTWKHNAIARLQAGSQSIETSAGNIEYHRSGTGPAVLIAHGTPGGYDQGIALARLLNSQQLTIIAVSRPGYLQTALLAGQTPEAQADLYATLLDSLHIEQAAIIGISGGGPSALQFALRHPERCRGLATISAITQRYAEADLRQDWSPFKHFWRRIYDQLLVFDPLFYAILPLTRLTPQASITEDLLRSVTMNQLRKTGYNNDMQQFAAMQPYALEQISVPTFVLHGTHDTEVPFTDAEFLVSKLTNVKFLIIPGGGHQTYFTHANIAMPALRTFLETLKSRKN